MKEKPELKLFIWTNFSKDYSSGLAFAIAETEEKARNLIIKERGGADPHDWGDLEVRSLKYRVGRSVSGGG